MINNPMINSPYYITVKGELKQEDINSYGYIIRDRETGEIQYCITLDIEGMGIRNNFLYHILLSYIKSVFNENDMLTDMRIAENSMITMTINVFERASGSDRYVLGAAYVNENIPTLELDVLLNEQEKVIVNKCVDSIKKNADWKNRQRAYTIKGFGIEPK